MKWILKTGLLLLPLIFCGCRSFDPEPRNADTAAVPTSYSRGPAVEGTLPNRWWESFDSPTLNELIGTALQQNYDLAAAWARLEQADALARKTGAALYPNLDLDADRGLSTVINDRDTTTTQNYGVGAVLSYELDLWGRVRAQRRAAVLDWNVSRADLEIAALTLSGTVADLWIQLQAVNTQIALVQQQLETNGKRLDVLRVRQRSGLSSALDIYQQQQTLAAAKALLPPLMEERELLQDQLALMAAAPPGSYDKLAAAPLPTLPGFPEVGVPASLLERRPDVRAAFLALQSGDWDVAAARAERLPALRLTGSLSAESVHLDELFDDWLARLAAGITAPLIDGGRRRAEVDRTRAVVKQRLAAYRAAVLGAVHEVEAAIVSERYRKQLLAEVEDQLALARRTLEEADRRYRNGLVDYITVLNAVDTTQRLEREVVRVKEQQLRNRITLYKALGGAWPRELQAPTDNDEEQTSNE